jgi:hypothetical protein
MYLSVFIRIIFILPLTSTFSHTTINVVSNHSKWYSATKFISQ